MLFFCWSLKPHEFRTTQIPEGYPSMFAYKTKTNFTMGSKGRIFYGIEVGTQSP